MSFNNLIRPEGTRGNCVQQSKRMTIQLAKNMFFIFIFIPSKIAARGAHEEEEACEEGEKGSKP